MEDIEEDDDVVREGSEFHKVLTNMGYTDFELISVNKSELLEKSEPTNEKYKLFKGLHNFFSLTSCLENIFALRSKFNNVSAKQLATILEMTSLLSEHAELIQSLLDKTSATSSWIKFAEWSTVIASIPMVGISYFAQESVRTSAMIFATSVAAITLYHKYEEFCTVRCLKNLILLQNELYYWYKRGLRMLRESYFLKSSGKQTQGEFSELHINRLKYLQPATEMLLKSMENVSQIYHHTFSVIANLLSQSALSSHLSINFDNDSFLNDGEITYETFKQSYYVYILVQSETMQILAMAYDDDTWINCGTIPNAQLTRITFNLYHLLMKEKTDVVRIIEEYENCKLKPVQRTFHRHVVSKWRDLYLNLDVLSRRLQTVYDAVGLIIKEIDKHENLDATDDDFSVALSMKINDVYKQIDTARNFAEFNNLLMAMIQRSRRGNENSVAEPSTFLPEIETNLPIVRDSDPQIFDEVFEEYITEEYLKPLYDDTDERSLENAKLDKLLAKNFMSELKEALIEKYKSMSERESKALHRKYPQANVEQSSIENLPAKIVSESEKSDSLTSTIPCPPPLPTAIPEVIKSRVFPVEKEEFKFRTPVPLPRASPNYLNAESVTLESSSQKCPILPPLPPLPPPEIDVPETCERFSIALPKNNLRKTPAFVTFEEEFIGSGENSDDDGENADSDESESNKPFQ